MNKKKKIGRSIYFALILLLELFFSSTQAQYSLVGNTIQTSPGIYRLTEDLPWQNGSVWNTTKINLNNSFDLSFELYFGNHDNGADGITFTLQRQGTNAGAPGQGLGAGGITPSVIVEYDTYNNTPYDLTSDHIAISKNGDLNHTTTNNLAAPVSANAGGTDIENGAWHKTRVKWDATTKTIEVYFDCALRLSYTGDIIANVFGGDPNVYYGFTAATGGSTNEQSVRDFYFVTDTQREDATICLGSSASFDFSDYYTYSWTPTTGINSSTSANPTFNPTVSTQYIATVTNNCFQTWKDTVDITVVNLPVVNVADKAVCAGSSATFDAGNAGSTFAWSGLGSGALQTTPASAAGTYTVTVTDGNGCQASDNATLTVNALPIVNLADKAICTGASTTFDAGNAGSTFAWSGLGIGASQTTTASTAGTYTVTVTNGNGCQASDNATLTINTLPIVAIADKAICAGASTTFDAGNAGSTFAWSGLGIGAAQTTPAFAAGTYTVTVTNGNGCQASDNATLTINALPIVNVADKAICAGSSTTFDAGNAGSTFAWSGLGIGASQTTPASAAGTYTVTVTNGNGCQASDNATLTLNALPIVNVADKAICTGASTTFDAGNTGSTFAWSGLGIGAAQTTPAFAAGTYTVTVTNGNGCQASDNAILTLNALPIVNVADKAICTGASTTFDAGNAGSTFAWSGLATGIAQTTTASTAGTYTVTVTNGNGCQASDNATLTLHALPVVNLGPDKSICPGSTTTLDAGTGFTYLWNNASTAQTLVASAAGTYSVTITDVNSCQANDALTVTMNSSLTVNLGPNQSICQGAAAVTFDAGNAGSTYLWNDGSTGKTLSANTAGTYSVNVTDVNGCSGSGSVVLTVNILPVVNISDKAICDGASTTFDAGNTGSSFAWSGLGSGNSQTSLASFEGTYTVTVTNSNGCEASDNATLTLYSLPIVNVADKAVCAGSATTFDADNAGATFAWSGLGTGATQTTPASAAGTYTVTVTNENGCQASDNATLTINALPVVNIPDQSVCDGLSAVFDAGNTGSSYQWSGLGAGTSQTNTASAAGIYTVTVTNGNGCQASDNATLTIHALPIVTLPDQSVCDGLSATFDAGNTGSTFMWSGLGIGTSQTATASTSGIYTVTVTDGNGCQNSDDATLTVNALPILNLGTDRSICPGTNTIIDAGNWTSYLWNDNSTNQNMTANTVGNFSVSITDNNGCTATDNLNITIKNNLTISLGNDKAICEGAAAVTFDATYAGANYIWNDNSTQATLTTSAAGIYSVLVTDNDGCTGKDTVVLTVNALPVINIGSDTAICEGSAPVVFDVNAGFPSYLWNDNSSLNNISANTAGTYFVEVTDDHGCIGKDTAQLSINSLPAINIGADTTICPGMSLTIDAGTWSAYLWNDTSTASTLTVFDAGAAFVTITDANGCKDSDTLFLSISNNLNFSLGADPEICANGAAVIFDPQVAPATYTWNTGEQTQSISKNTAGVYIVEVTTPNGCSGKDTVVLSVNALPEINLADQIVCEGTAATFDAGTFASYVWNNGSTAQNISASLAGAYWVEVSDNKGCKNSDTATLAFHEFPAMTLAGKSVCDGQSATLDAGAGFVSYLWGTGENTRTFTSVNGGTYSVTVSDSNGCSRSASAKITVRPKPAVNLGAFTPVCSNTPSFKLNGGIPIGGKYRTLYQSQEIETDTFDANMMGIGQHTIYYFYTDTYGCQNSAQAAIPVNGLPLLSMEDKSICKGDVTYFDAGADFVNYQWNNNSNTQKIITGIAGTYTVTITDANGCTNNDTAVLVVHEAPVVNIGPDQSICENTPLSLSSDIVTKVYQWNTGASTPSIAVNVSGKYSITVTDSNSCSSTDEVQVNIIPVPHFDLGDDIEICEGQTATIASNLSDAKLLWSTGEYSKEIEVKNTAKISLQAYYDFSCPTYDSVSVNVIPYPVSALTSDTIVCFNEISSLTLDAGNDAQNYVWQNGNSAATLSITEEGKYSVTLTNGKNCSVIDTVAIKELCITSLFVPNAFTPFNNDGHNNVFYAKGINAGDFHMMIFNRWGELIYESYDINEGWDGTYKGNPVQIDVYVWKITWKGNDQGNEFFNNQRIGNVSVIR